MYDYISGTLIWSVPYEENLRWFRLQIFERVCNRAGPVPPGRSGPPSGTYRRERRGGEEWNGGEMVGVGLGVVT